MIYVTLIFGLLLIIGGPMIIYRSIKLLQSEWDVVNNINLLLLFIISFSFSLIGLGAIISGVLLIAGLVTR